MDLPPVSIIVAMTPHGVIGNKGTMPWARLRRDMERFKRLTTPSAVIMGPKTYESLPPKFRPLSGRVNIILTRNQDYKAQDGVIVVHDPKLALQQAAIQKCADCFVIGGSMVYATFLPEAERLLVTYVWAKLEGDTYFPHWDRCDWRRVFIERKLKTWPGDTYPTMFAEWRRLPKSRPKDTQHSWPYPYKDDLATKPNFEPGGVITGDFTPSTKKIL